MRRMYSVKELTKIIGEVFDQKIEAGAFTESIADAVDAYLVENPVDITALEGQDISLATLTSTGDVNVGGDLDVTGEITGAEIIEKMSGYSFVPQTKENVTINMVYAGIVKNGNKLTAVAFAEVTRTGDVANDYFRLGDFRVPADVLSKLYPYILSGDNCLSSNKLIAVSTQTAYKELLGQIYKYGSIAMFVFNASELTLNTKYYLRYEVTFLLSDNLAS